MKKFLLQISVVLYTLTACKKNYAEDWWPPSVIYRYEVLANPTADLEIRYPANDAFTAHLRTTVSSWSIQDTSSANVKAYLIVSTAGDTKPRVTLKMFADGKLVKSKEADLAEVDTVKLEYISIKATKP